MIGVLENSQVNLIKREDDMIDKALIIVLILYKEKRDEFGNMYIDYLLTIMRSLETYEEKVVGLLYNILEDNNITINDLADLGFSQSVIEAVLLLKEADNIDSLLQSHNMTAIKVKRADINYKRQQLTLLNKDTKSESTLIEEYTKSFVKVNNYLKGKE